MLFWKAAKVGKIEHERYEDVMNQRSIMLPDSFTDLVCLLSSYYFMSFFACAKKDQKSTPENDIHRVFGEEVGSGFCATVASEAVLYCAPR